MGLLDLPMKVFFFLQSKENKWLLILHFIESHYVVIFFFILISPKDIN